MTVPGGLMMHPDRKAPSPVGSASTVFMCLCLCQTNASLVKHRVFPGVLGLFTRGSVFVNRMFIIDIQVFI